MCHLGTKRRYVALTRKWTRDFLVHRMMINKQPHQPGLISLVLIPPLTLLLIFILYDKQDDSAYQKYQQNLLDSIAEVLRAHSPASSPKVNISGGDAHERRCSSSPAIQVLNIYLLTWACINNGTKRGIIGMHKTVLTVRSITSLDCKWVHSMLVGKLTYLW